MKELKLVLTVQQMWILAKAIEQFGRDEFKIFLDEYDVDIDKFTDDMGDLVNRIENVVAQG